MSEVTYEDLVDAWWKTADAMNVTKDDSCPKWLRSWHTSVFERILQQCGWTVERWNHAVESINNKEGVK